MAIATLDDLIAAKKQTISFYKSASRTTVASVAFSTHDLAGQPGAGTLAGTNTANGVVPTDADAGFPKILDFDAGAKGYVLSADIFSGSSSYFGLYDVVFKAGAYAFNANVTLSSQPSFSNRVPNGTDFTGCELWIECVTAFTGNQSIAVTYTNQDGTTGRTTGTIATGVAPIVGRMLRLPLQAGDTGVQKVESVVSTVSTAGTFNVLVMRRLAALRVGSNGWLATGVNELGLPEIFQHSALTWIQRNDSTTSSTYEAQVTIVSK